MEKRFFEYEKTKRCTCTLYMTESCNLNCIYCYEHIKGTRILSIDIAKSAITSTFNRAIKENVEYVEILFHGGEPFIAFNQIKEICEWLWSNDWPKKYICYATTNGTLVHGEIKEWLALNSKRFVVGLSLDGTPEMHNYNRSNSYDKIDIEFFRDTWPDQGVKMTPSPATLSSLAEGVLHIHSLGFKRNNCTFASGVRWDLDDKGNPIDYLNILQDQLMKLAQYYLSNANVIPIDMMNIKFIAVAAGMDGMVDKLCGAGTIMRCWTPDGQCLPCHLFYEVSKEKGIKFDNFTLPSYKKLSDPHCHGCILEPICPTCYGGNFITYGDISRRDPYTCNITKIRALASSWMVGQMLEKPDLYSVFQGLGEDELAMIAKGVIMTQDYLDKSGFIAGLNG